MSDPLPDLTCPDCKGKGQKYLHLNYGTGDKRSGWQWVKCWRCNGEKVITSATLASIEAGKGLNELLKAKGYRYDLECLASQGVDGVALSSALMGRVSVERIAEIREMVERLEAKGEGS